MSEKLSAEKKSGSVEERLKIKERQLNRLLIKSTLTLMLLWATLFWLSLYRIPINLLIVATPILSFYGYQFYRYFKKYNRLNVEIEELKVLQKKIEDENYHIQEDVLYFRRH